MLRWPVVLVVLVVAGPGWAATVKRDTQDTLAHITDSIKDLVGLETDRNFIEEVKDINEENYCVVDSQCMEYVQYCNKGPLYGACKFHLWFWVGSAALISFLFCSCITSLVCCCCTSLCRKAT